MTNNVTADIETLFRQAPMTAHDYMLHAVDDIDEIFGAGYAKAHPELVGAYIQTAAADFHTSHMKVGLQDLASAIDGLASATDQQEEAA